MREFLMGVLGAAFVYPLAWYAAEPTPTSERAEPAVPAERVASGSPSTKKAGRAEQRTPAASAQPGAPVGPSQEPVAVLPAAQPARRRVLPLPEALPKTIDQMRELQHFASDPDALADRVQTMERNDAELAELEAFAEKFVELPRDRVGERISGASEAGTERPRRQGSKR